MSLLRRLGIWALIVMLYLHMILLPLLQLSLLTYEAVTTERWISAVIWGPLTALFVWMVICAWLKVNAESRRRRDALVANAECGVGGDECREIS